MMTHMDASLIAPMASSLIQPVAFSLINAITGKREDKFLPLLALSLIMKVPGKGVTRSGRRCNKVDHMDKHF